MVAGQKQKRLAGTVLLVKLHYLPETVAVVVVASEYQMFVDFSE